MNQIYVTGPVVEAIKTAMDDMAKDQEAQDKARADKKETDAADPDESQAVRFALLQWKEWNDPQNPQRPPREEMSRMIDSDLQQIARERETTKSEEVRRKLDAVSAALALSILGHESPGPARRSASSSAARPRPKTCSILKSGSTRPTASASS